MSLGALDFGLIVDGAVVMVENAVRRRAEAQHEAEARTREPPERTILESCLEVARPVVFAVAIIAIVYLPILSLRGIEGKMFVPMALTVIFALLGSLILSLNLRSGDADARFERQSFGKGKFSDSLGEENLSSRRSLSSAATARRLWRLPSRSVLISGAIFPYLGSEFIPRLDEGDLAVQVQRLPSISLEAIGRNYDRSRKSFDGISRS